MRNCGWGSDGERLVRPKTVVPRAGGGSSTPRPLDSITDISGILDPAFAGMTTEYALAFSRHDVPEACIFVTLSNQRAQGRPDARCTRGLVCICALKKRAHEHTGSAGASRPSLRNGFTAYSVLSPVNGFLATVAREKPASRELDASTAASGPHVFAVRVTRPRLARASRPSHPAARS